MFVRNPCTNDVRVLREAATLHAAGWPTTIVALQPGGSDAPPDHEERDGVRIIRVPAPAGWRVRWRDMRYYPWRALRGVPRAAVRALRSGPSRIGAALGIVGLSLVTLPYTVVQAARYVVSRRARPRPHDVDDGLDHLAWWSFSVRGWAAAATAVAPPADVYHGHDLTALPAALGAAARAEAAVVYDSHELFVEAAEEARQPWWVKRVIATYEKRLIRRVAAIVTVNGGIAQELHRRYGGPSPVVVHNAPPRQAPPEPRPDLLRHAAGIPTDAPVVLYHGGFQTGRGLEILAEAFQEPVLRRAHLVYLGYGSAQPMLERIASDPRFGGRIHVLPRVPPDVLLDWVASADLAAMIIQPTTLNHRLSSPNKLFEAMAVGVPVVASDLPVMAAIVRATRCGLVVDPTDAQAIAAACAEILDASPDAASAWRRRALAAAHDCYNWERESAGLLTLYERLADR
ncbi:MAG TPA: glycosyltransferase [Candidatus Limnocylindrales bacterium]|nr:glycosyltransferase [Candidatus Limnocylindrales bacterium]